MNSKKTLYIMVGVPGSGKSTWVKEHIKKNEVHISRDIIRFSMLEENVPYFHNEKAVEREYYKQIREALENDKIKAVYADATQSNENSRRKFLENVFPSGNSKKVNICPVTVFTSLQTCLNQNAQRSGREYVPETAITRMYNNFTFPMNDSFNKKYNEYINVNKESENK